MKRYEPCMPISYTCSPVLGRGFVLLFRRYSLLSMKYSKRAFRNWIMRDFLFLSSDSAKLFYNIMHRIYASKKKIGQGMIGAFIRCQFCIDEFKFPDHWIHWWSELHNVSVISIDFIIMILQATWKCIDCVLYNFKRDTRMSPTRLAFCLVAVGCANEIAMHSPRLYPLNWDISLEEGNTSLSRFARNWILFLFYLWKMEVEAHYAFIFPYVCSIFLRRSSSACGSSFHNVQLAVGVGGIEA